MKKKKKKPNSDHRGAVSFETRFVGRKIAGPAPVEVTASDSGSSGERTVVEKKNAGGGGTTAYVIQDSGVPHTSATEMDDADVVTVRLQGRPQEGENNVALAVSHVINRLNAAGAQWGGVSLSPRDSKAERGVDAVAHGPGGSTLDLQVVSAEQGVQGELARKGQVKKTLTVAAAADALLGSIMSKRLAAHPDTVLVLDDTNVGQFMLDRILEAFRERHAAEAAAVGFKAIWLAGPTAEQTVRLAPED